MAKNSIQVGNVIRCTAPAGGVISGEPLWLGAFFVVPTTDAVEGEEFEGHLEQVWELPKVAAEAPTFGAPAYWDDTAKLVTTVATGNKLIGAYIEARANGDETCWVRLNGVAVI